MQDLTWEKVISHCGLKNDRDISHLAKVVTYARKQGIGQPISFQKTGYTDSDLNIIKIILHQWMFVCRNTKMELLSDVEIKSLINLLIKSVRSQEYLDVVAIFCPSYKKGVGCYGYNQQIGKNTVKQLNLLSGFINAAKAVSFKLNCHVYFCDLILENFFRLIDSDEYERDLECNFNSFRERALTLMPTANIEKLSSFGYLNESLGPYGIARLVNESSKNIYKQVFLRNKAFYKTCFNWSDEEIRERTLILMGSYALMGNFFKERFPLGLMFWTESMYERAAMYSLDTGVDTFPIIFPESDVIN